eukprot:32085-Chlamydomonas_euryale.AAC.4
MVRRRTLQWMGHVLPMDEGRLPRQVFDCSLARSVTEDGPLQFGGATRKVPVVAPRFGTFSSCLVTNFIPWPEIQAAAAAERALDRHAWRDDIKSIAPLEFMKPQQPGSAADPDPGLFNDAVCNDCDFAEDMGAIVSGKASVKSKECGGCATPAYGAWKTLPALVVPCWQAADGG